MTLLADSTELWDVTNGYACELRKGRPGKDLPVFRGTNTVVPGQAGQTHRPKVADHFLVTIYAEVIGDGTGQSAAESYLTRMEVLNAILNPDNGQFTLTLNNGAEGLASGEQATITVEFLRWIIEQEGPHYRTGEIECISVSTPPGWTVTEGS